VYDAAAQVAGRLWIVQETTAQRQAQLLLERQTQRLAALRKLGQHLSDIAGSDDLLCRAASYMYDAFGAEAVGLAIRYDQNSRRSRQLLHRGTGGYLLEVNRALLDGVEQHLMPRTLASQDVVFWPDLPASQPWTKPFLHAGLTSVASAPLRGSGDMQGIIWVARRNGERLERHHIHLLEALAPLLAARIEFAQLRDRLRQLELTDPTTDLPNRRQLHEVLTRLQNRPGYPWALVLLKLDHFRDLNQTLDHLAADRLLRQVAGALQGAVRKSCLVARFDGPLFAIACTGASMAQAAGIAERLRQCVRALPVTMPDGRDLTLTASLGVAASPDDGQHASDLLAAAAARIEVAKRTGRDRVVAGGLPGDRQAG
jgi:diguanylate cyclase (GGDEF)-like protein